MTQAKQSGRKWQGEVGYVSREMLSKHVGNLTRPAYYVAGPPAMVNAMVETLQSAGVDDRNIRWEDFSGY